jgi:hypothetical protein
MFTGGAAAPACGGLTSASALTIGTAATSAAVIERRRRRDVKG